MQASRIAQTSSSERHVGQQRVLRAAGAPPLVQRAPEVTAGVAAVSGTTT